MYFKIQIYFFGNYYFQPFWFNAAIFWLLNFYYDNDPRIRLQIGAIMFLLNMYINMPQTLYVLSSSTHIHNPIHISDQSRKSSPQTRDYTDRPCDARICFKKIQCHIGELFQNLWGNI